MAERIRRAVKDYAAQICVGVLVTVIAGWLIWLSSSATKSEASIGRLEARVDGIENTQQAQMEGVKNSVKQIEKLMYWHLGMSTEKPQKRDVE